MLIRRGRRVVVSLLVVGLATTACTPLALPLGDTPIGTPSASSTLIGCDRAVETVQITSDAHLDPACTYTGGVEITASNVVFDCRGAHITDVEGSHGRGISVSANSHTSLDHITVRNCIVSGFLNNVRVSREGFKALPAGSEYEAPFSDIVIENSRLYSSRGSGVFVNAFVTDVTLRNLEIANSGGVGIYLEAGSKDNVVEHNTIRNNGFGDVDPVNGIPFDLGGGVQVRVLQTGREGIAIDGSRNNRVAGNFIHSNAAGGIFLYKNCGEYATQKPNQWWQRNYGADGNVLEGNTVANEPEGIWVGSRMAEDQYFMDCSDPAYESGPLHRIHLDYARNNALRNNTLTQVGNAVRVEDNGTTVEGNRISSNDPAARGVLIGTKWRTQVLAQPVDTTSISGNTVTIPNPAAAYGWVHGHTNTAFGPNLVNGTPATLTAGTQPTINAWLFVVRVWVP